MGEIKKRVFITGIVSLLGKYLTKQLQNQYEIYGSCHRVTMFPLVPPGCLFPLDIANLDAVSSLVEKIQPHTVIHLAALSNIDYCELHPDLARKINTVGTQNICHALRHHPSHLIFVSSNAIFKGDKPPYKETDSPEPLNIYGETKLAGERMALGSLASSTVIRSTSMFGWPPPGARENDVTFYLQRLTDILQPINLVNDRFFNPIYALRTAHVIKQLIDKKIYGLYHVGGKSRVTRYSLVQSLVSNFNITHHPPLKAVSSDHFPQFAARPHDACLATEKIESMLNFVPYNLDQELQQLRLEKH